MIEDRCAGAPIEHVERMARFTLQDVQWRFALNGLSLDVLCMATIG